MKSILIIVSFFTFINTAIASEITECTHFQVPVNYDAANFKFTKKTDSDGFDNYHYLLDSFFLKDVGALELHASVRVFLKNSNKAVVRYSEAKWERKSDTQMTLVETTFEDEFETTWSSSGSDLVVDGVGQGQSATCYDDGGYDVYFTYEKNLGPSQIKNKKMILHYGFSTYDPFE